MNVNWFMHIHEIFLIMRIVDFSNKFNWEKVEKKMSRSGGKHVDNYLQICFSCIDSNTVSFSFLFFSFLELYSILILGIFLVQKYSNFMESKYLVTFPLNKFQVELSYYSPVLSAAHRWDTPWFRNPASEHN